MYVCEECGRGFATKKSLGLHRSWHRRNAWRHDVDLTEMQRQILLGGLMGDMSIGYHARCVSPIVQVGNCIQQAEYVGWKYSILESVATSPPKTREYATGFGNRCSMVGFSTKALPCLQQIYDIVKRNGITTLTDEWLSEVADPLSLAVWYLDDGSITKIKDRNYQKVYGHVIQISIGNAAIEEVDSVVRWMSRQWGIDVMSTRRIADPTRPKKSVVYTIRIYKTADVDAFLDIVRPIALRSGMDYKVVRDYTYTTSR